MTVVKGCQVTETVHHHIHLEILDDLVDRFLVPKVGPICHSLTYPGRANQKRLQK